jgi:hypothetical protein
MSLTKERVRQITSRHQIARRFTTVPELMARFGATEYEVTRAIQAAGLHKARQARSRNIVIADSDVDKVVRHLNLHDARPRFMPLGNRRLALLAEESVQYLLGKWGFKCTADEPAAIYLTCGMEHPYYEPARPAGIRFQVNPQYRSWQKPPTHLQGDAARRSLLNTSRPGVDRFLFVGSNVYPDTKFHRKAVLQICSLQTKSPA